MSIHTCSRPYSLSLRLHPITYSCGTCRELFIDFHFSKKIISTPWNWLHAGRFQAMHEIMQHAHTSIRSMRPDLGGASCMQSVKFRSVISPLLFHARARGRRVGQLEAPAGKFRAPLPSAIWGPHVGVSRSLAACDWRARLVFLAKHLMDHRCGVSGVPH